MAVDVIAASSAGQGYSNGISPTTTIIPTSTLQAIMAELRALDTASILDTAVHADAALQAVISEQTRAGLSMTLRWGAHGVVVVVVVGYASQYQPPHSMLEASQLTGQELLRAFQSMCCARLLVYSGGASNQGHATVISNLLDIGMHRLSTACGVGGLSYVPSNRAAGV